jgi:hypothetical protein
MVRLALKAGKEMQEGKDNNIKKRRWCRALSRNADLITSLVIL